MLIQDIEKTIGKPLSCTILVSSFSPRWPRFSNGCSKRTHRKKRIVTKQRGKIDCRRVKSEALVTFSSLLRREFLRKPIAERAVLLAQFCEYRRRRTAIRLWGGAPKFFSEEKASYYQFESTPDSLLLRNETRSLCNALHQRFPGLQRKHSNLGTRVRR